MSDPVDQLPFFVVERVLRSFMAPGAGTAAAFDIVGALASAGLLATPPPSTPPDPFAALARRIEALETAAGISGGWNGG